MVDNLRHQAYGAIFDTITTRIFENYSIVIPNDKIFKTFHSVIEPLFKKIFVNQSQIINLTNLRDLLIPQLISGKLRIPDPEKFLEELNNE